jgi:hypothetical protein
MHIPRSIGFSINLHLFALVFGLVLLALGQPQNAPARTRVSEAAEKLGFRIRASLQRCRKFSEIRCPFRG